MAFKSILRPNMEYSAPIWDPYTKANIQLLAAVQRSAARFVCNKYSRHESVLSMLQDLDWPLLEQKREESRLTLFLRIVHKEVDIDEHAHAWMKRNPRVSRKGTVSSSEGPRFFFFFIFIFFFSVCLFPISGGPNTDVSQHIGEDKYISKTGHGPFSGRTGGAVY